MKKKNRIFALILITLFSMVSHAETITIPIYLRTTGNHVTFTFDNHYNTTKMNIVKSDGTVVCDLLPAIRWGYLWGVSYYSLDTGNSITIDTDETYYLDFDQGYGFKIHFSGGGGHITHGLGVYFGSSEEHCFFQLAAIRMKMYQNGVEVTQLPVLLDPDDSIWTNRDLEIKYNETISYYEYGGSFCASTSTLSSPTHIALYIDLGYDTYYYGNI